MAQIERGEAKIQRRISIKKALDAKVRDEFFLNFCSRNGSINIFDDVRSKKKTINERMTINILGSCYWRWSVWSIPARVVCKLCSVKFISV